MKFVYCTILLFLLSLSAAAQTIQVEKVIDSNIFLLKNGLKIKLANVESPSIFSNDSLQKELAHKIIKFAEDKLIGEPRLYAEYVNYQDTDTSLTYVHLFIKYLIETLNVNKTYLENGYGKFKQEHNSTYNPEYLKASQKAKKSNMGVWRFNNEIKSKSLSYFRVSLGKGAKYFETQNIQFIEAYYEFIAKDKKYVDFNFKVGGLFNKEEGSGSCEDSGTQNYKEFFPQLYTDIGLIIKLNYMRIRLGSIFMIRGHGYCDEKPYMFAHPNFGVNLGLIDKIYLTFDAYRFMHYPPVTLGINYSFNAPHSKIWVGWFCSDEYRGYCYETSYLIYKNIVFDSEGRYFSQSDYLFLRFGIGFIIR